MSPGRQGVLAAGNFVVDHVLLIDRYPAEEMLVTIEEETTSNGGGPYNVLTDLVLMQAPFPLAAVGIIGNDANGDWILADCGRRGIDTSRMIRTDQAPTSYTYAMSVRQTGRRTFLHRRGANTLLAPEHFDFSGSSARIFHLGYMMLLDSLDRWVTDGRTGAALVLERAAQAGLETVVDLVSTSNPQYREIVLSALPFTDHLLLNELEASMVLGRSLDAARPTDLLEAAEQLCRTGVRETVAIHFEQGVVAVDCRTRRSFMQGSVALPAHFSQGATGAGDAFTAGYIFALHQDKPTPERLIAGVCCAAACLQTSTASGGLRPLAACLEFGQRFGFRSLPAP